MWADFKSYQAWIDPVDTKAPIGVDVQLKGSVPLALGMMTFNPGTGRLEDDKHSENGIAPHKALRAAGTKLTCLYSGGEVRKLWGDDYNLPEVDWDNVAFDEDGQWGVWYIIPDRDLKGRNPHLPPLLVVYEVRKASNQVITRVLHDQEYQHFANHFLWTFREEQWRKPVAICDAGVQEPASKKLRVSHWSGRIEGKSVGLACQPRGQREWMPLSRM